MVLFNTLFNEQRILTQQHASSKKRLLELLSPLLVDDDDQIDEEDIFSCLLERERLGSTGIGRGVAIPHSRLEGVIEAKIAIVTLEEPIDFNAPDAMPVDIVFALLVPMEHNDEHLEILSQAANLFKNEQHCNAVRNAQTSAQLFNYLQNLDKI